MLVLNVLPVYISITYYEVIII